MPRTDVVAALEIGTSKVVAMVGEMRENGRVMITGMGEHASKGVRKGEVIDLENATICARGALLAAEESGQATIREVYVALSGGHIESHVSRGSARVSDPSGVITQGDVEQVRDLARVINLPADREILHTICQHFCIDEQERVTNPEGLEGAKLSVDMLAVHGIRNRMHNTINVVRSVPMDVEDVAFGGLCAALAVLTPEQKEIGALVIDLGGGTTDCFAYAGKAAAYAGAFGVGGDHVTNDIALAFNISRKQAEALKCASGGAIVDSSDRSRRVTAPPEVGFPDREIGVASLDTVINVRMDEIFRMVKNSIESSGVIHQLGSGVVLTGGGAKMRGVAELAQKVFSLPCRIGKPTDVDGRGPATEGPDYAVPVGLVVYGFKNVGRHSQAGLWGWLKSLRGGGRT